MEIQEISVADIKRVQKELKKWNKEWVKIMAEKMSMTVDKVYNIVNSINKHQQARRLFIKCAKECLQDMAKEQKKAIDIIESLPNA